MKILFTTLALLLFIFFQLKAQIAMNEDGSKANPSTMLHIKKNASALVLEGETRVFMEFMPTGFDSVNRGWLGFGHGGENRFTIKNHLGDMNFSTEGNFRYDKGIFLFNYKTDSELEFLPDPNYYENNQYIAFGHQGISEDFIGYKNNTFFFMDMLNGGDEIPPNLVIGGNVSIGKTNP